MWVSEIMNFKYINMKYPSQFIGLMMEVRNLTRKNHKNPI